MLKISSTATVAKGAEYNLRFQPGMTVAIDAIKKSESRSGYSLRVVGVWKKPTWFDLGWFKEFQR